MTDYMDELRTMWGSALSDAARGMANKNAAENGDGKMSVREIERDGINYGIGVYLDSTLLENLTDKERVQMVKERVKELGGQSFTAYDDSGNAVSIKIAEARERFKNKNGKKVSVTDDLATKYSENKIKQESVVLADELITTAKSPKESTARYPHGWLDNYGKNKWEQWTSYIQDKSGNVWAATLHVANARDGLKYLYDINPIKAVNPAEDTKKVERRGKSRTPLLAHSITGSAENVNTKSEKNSARDVAEDNKTAETYFGRTYRISEAGYLLRNGHLLDFSGRHEGTPGGYRTVDHRDISDAFDGDYGSGEYGDAMIQFMRAGNIRLSPESGGINLSVKPTKSQLETLERYIQSFRGEVMLDIDNEVGDTVASVEYGRGTRSSTVLTAINDYFDSGVIPESTEARYSTREIDGQPIAWIENSGLSSKDLRNYKKVAEYIGQHIGEVYTIIESGQRVYIGEDLPREYTQSEYTKRLLKNQSDTLRAKNKAASVLGDMIEIASGRRWERTKHTHNKDAKYGMYRYNSRFAFATKDAAGGVNVHAYDVELLIRNASDGKKYLYDIVNIKKNTAYAIELQQREYRSGGIKAASRNGVSENSIRNTAANVNTQNKYSMRDVTENDTKQELAERKKSYAQLRRENVALILLCHMNRSARRDMHRTARSRHAGESAP